MSRVRLLMRNDWCFMILDVYWNINHYLLFVLMRRLLLFINLYITIELLICKDDMGLTIQIDKSLLIPPYNCTLNIRNEKLMNMTSLGG